MEDYVAFLSHGLTCRKVVCHDREKEQDELTASTHLNWPQNMRPSVTETRRFLLRRELSQSVASSLSSGRKVVFGSSLMMKDVCDFESLSLRCLAGWVPMSEQGGMKEMDA